MMMVFVLTTKSLFTIASQLKTVSQLVETYLVNIVSLNSGMLLSSILLIVSNFNFVLVHLTFGNRDFIEVSVHVNSYFNQIIATQIPCKSKLRAPDHCLQYFTQPNGMVKSFDFGGQQQSNQKYSVCVKPTDESKTITWKACSWMQDSEAFNIVSNYGNDILSCDTDWVQVTGSEKRCDRFLPLTSSWKAYDLLVNFDSREMPEPFPIHNRPVDSNNHCLPENCEYLSIPGVYECVCVGEHSCQCVLVNTIPVQLPDLENRGFCLEYEQLG